MKVCGVRRRGEGVLYVLCRVGLVCADASQKLQDALDAERRETQAKEKERASLADQVLQLEKQLEVAKVRRLCMCAHM